MKAIVAQGFFPFRVKRMHVIAGRCTSRAPFMPRSSYLIGSAYFYRLRADNSWGRSLLMDSLLDKLNGTSSDRAQQQLDALREALEIRLSALEAVLADPSRGESLEGLIVELARVATEEAQAAALKVCLDVKLEADVRVADARVAAQETVDEERSANAELRRGGEQGRQRLANLE